ncbi:DUF2267 domain-containing protein [Gloeobacter morelensis]|uniref:DUF2267 domain-containing protein n=1 Tax=Gloeobacter morelensis MG652769 TaxID=2781736 RepID=A0ABY3PM47_9CYAN|nr:DUF2267 domain-containing protein [Gloeobacter morelensis]UFP94674.1 DUF2267 domain-containing protein [Gloeobacter morelensis MG652769]
MDHDQFVKKVRIEAGFESQAQALSAIQVVLEIMREHMAGREPHHLAAQLPQGIAEFLSPLENADARGERFGLDEFYERIAQKAGIDVAEAERRAGVVVDVLTKAVSKGEMRDVRGHFPKEYEQLFGASVR